MTSDERRKLEKQLAANGYKPSTQNSNNWSKGPNTAKFISSNRMNWEGNTRTGYANNKDYLNKKG